MPQYIFQTACNDEDYNGDCDYGIIEFDPVYAKSLLDKMDTAKKLGEQDSNFLRANYFDYSADYFSHFDALDDVLEDFDFSDCNLFEVPESFVIPEESFQRKDVCTVHVDGNDLFYECVPKHTSILIWSPCISRTVLESICQPTTD